MAQQREPIVATVATEPEDTRSQAEKDLDAAVLAATKDYAGLRVSLLERSSVSTALDVILPPHLHGEWVRNEPLRIKDKQEIGFVVDKVYAPKQSLHDANADGTAVVGDLIYMVCSKENKRNVDKLRADEYDRRHGKPGAINQVTQEERGFVTDQKTLIGSHIGSAVESRAIPVAIDTNKKE